MALLFNSRQKVLAGKLNLVNRNEILEYHFRCESIFAKKLLFNVFRVLTDVYHDESYAVECKNYTCCCWCSGSSSVCVVCFAANFQWCLWKVHSASFQDLENEGFYRNSGCNQRKDEICQNFRTYFDSESWKSGKTSLTCFMSLV